MIGKIGHLRLKQTLAAANRALHKGMYMYPRETPYHISTGCKYFAETCMASGFHP